MFKLRNHGDASQIRIRFCLFSIQIQRNSETVDFLRHQLELRKLLDIEAIAYTSKAYFELKSLASTYLIGEFK